MTTARLAVAALNVKLLPGKTEREREREMRGSREREGKERERVREKESQREFLSSARKQAVQ